MKGNQDNFEKWVDMWDWDWDDGWRSGWCNVNAISAPGRVGNTLPAGKVPVQTRPAVQKLIMANFNKTIIAGRITRDIELRHAGQTTIAQIGVALNRKWKTESGEEREEVTFVDVTAFGKQADVVAKYFRKGSNILIEGRLKMDSWDDKATGQKKTKLGVVLESFSFLDSAKEGGEQAPRPMPTRPNTTKPTVEDEDQQIPF